MYHFCFYTTCIIWFEIQNHWQSLPSHCSCSKRFKRNLRKSSIIRMLPLSCVKNRDMINEKKCLLCQECLKWNNTCIDFRKLILYQAYHRSTVQAKKNFFCYILSLLITWNIIFLLFWGIFRKFPVQAKLSLSPYACCVHARGGRESFLFFLRLAALCMVLLRRWIGGMC